MIKKIKPVILILIHLLILEGAYGQASTAITDILKKRFDNYCKSVPREEVYVHSDRSEYISGEDLWFNVFVIDRKSFSPSLTSRIVYFELLNKNNRPVVQKSILIINGFGPSEIILPDTLSTGNYTIRAYTNWMKNFLPDNCFLKDISIYNPLSNNAFQNKKHTPARTGEFMNRNINAPGIKTDVNYSGADSIAVLINTSKEFRTENKNLVCLFIQTHGNINHVSTEKLSDQKTRIMVPKTELMAGINEITIFDSKGEPVSVKYIYTRANENKTVSIISPDSSGARGKVTMELEIANGPSTMSGLSDISLSVVPVKTDSKNFDLYNYMIFGSEFGVSVRNIDINGLTDKLRDSVLANITSNWIDWPLIMSEKKHTFLYKAEKEDHFLRGELLTEKSKGVHNSRLILMCSPGKEATFQYARTDTSGNFNFRIHIDEGLKDLIFMPDEINENQKLLIESPYSDKYFHSENSADTSKERIPDYISKLSINSQVQRIYGNVAFGPLMDPVFFPEKPIRFYGKPDFELLLSDYITLPVMSEIFYELLPDVSLKKKKTGDEISITYHIDDSQYTTFPCLMIDGVIIKDASLISGLDPALVVKIDVLKGKYVVGKYIFPGLINVITKAADFNSVSMPDYMVRLPYRVIDPVRTFYSPDYSSAEMKESTVPDYRNTLYWNPAVKTDTNGKAKVEFWSSDNKGDYVINIQGFANGKMVSFRKNLKIN